MTPSSPSKDQVDISLMMVEMKSLIKEIKKTTLSILTNSKDREKEID